MLALMGNVSAFFAAFALVCAGVGAILPPPKVPIVTTKLDWLTEHGDEYDVLFIGSSRTFRQLLPEIFDAEMAAAGQTVRSFNAGVDGMRPPEDTYFLEKIMASRTKPLRLAVVECNPIRLRQRELDRDTLRAVYWHDNARTGTMFRAAFLSDGKKRSWSRRFEKITEALPIFAEHAEYWMWQNTNLGRGNEFLVEWTGVSHWNGLLEDDLGVRSDGYKAIAQADSMNDAQILDYKKGLAAMMEKQERGGTGDLVSIDEVREKKRLIERAGGQMVLVLPPFVGTGFFRPKPDEGLPPLLDFSDPEKYPELFSVEHRSDSGHTNFAGSQIYTRLIVREVLPLLKKEAGKK